MRVLSATADRAEWDALIARLPLELQDVHFTSAYGRVQEATGAGKAILAVETSAFGGFVAQPFLMRRIGDTELFDLTNLYGFGGPFVHALAYSSASVGRMFLESLTAWAQENRVVSEHCVLHPLFAFFQLPLLESENIVFSKYVVVIEDLKTFYEYSVSRRIRRAVTDLRDRCIMVEAPDALTFSRLYDKAMDRLAALSRWRFEPEYWEAHLREPVGARVIHLLEKCESRRSLLVIGNGKTAYAHFLGSDGEGDFDPILYFDTARYLAKQGYDRFHLGGGLTEREDDPLFFFKSGFSKARYRVGSYRRIFQPNVYATLEGDKARREVETFGRESTATWFPAYRREFA